MTQAISYDRRRNLSGRKYQPKQLNEKHHEILRLAMLGYSNVEIAERLSCTPATVSIVRNSGLGRQQASLLKAEADHSALETAKRIRELAPDAIEAIQQIMMNEELPANVRLSAAKDVLDRAGYAAPKQVNVSSTTLNLTGDDLEGLKAIALQRAQANGMVIDVSPDREDSEEEC